MKLHQAVCKLWDQSYPPKSTFDVTQIPDLTGRVVIVTGTYPHDLLILFYLMLSSGGYVGIGKEITKASSFRSD